MTCISKSEAAKYFARNGTAFIGSQYGRQHAEFFTPSFRFNFETRPIDAM